MFVTYRIKDGGNEDVNGSGLGVGPLWRKMVAAAGYDWQVPHRLFNEISAPAGLRLEGAD